MKTAFRIGLLITAAILAILCTAVPATAADFLAEARTLATSGHAAEALQLLGDHLQSSPDDADARVLYGLVLSWERRYDEARQQFRTVLAKHPDYGDALQGLINVELWSDHPRQAEQIAASAAARKPHDTRMLFAQAKALRAQDRDREALSVLNQVLAIDPLNQDALSAERSVKEDMEQWRVSVTHAYERFLNGGGPWNEFDASLGRATPLGSVTATFSRADRFGMHSNLSELTFYPHIRKGTYGYLGFGYSADETLFPRYRLGAEIFQSLPHGMEASVGYRRFQFSTATNMYTGSVGKYLGNWLFTTRMYFTPDDLGTTTSVSVSARRYLSHDGDYVGIRVGTGPSPFDPRSRDDLATLQAFSGYFEMKKAVGPRLVLGLLVGSALEDRFYRVAVEHLVLQSTVYYRF